MFDRACADRGHVATARRILVEDATCLPHVDQETNNAKTPNCLSESNMPMQVPFLANQEASCSKTQNLPSPANPNLLPTQTSNPTSQPSSHFKRNRNSLCVASLQPNVGSIFKHPQRQPPRVLLQCTALAWGIVTDLIAVGVLAKNCMPTFVSSD